MDFLPEPQPPLTLYNRAFKRLSLLLSDPWAWTLSLCFALVFLFAARKNLDFDLGYHLASGRWILQHLDVPRQDTFTFGAAGHEYLDSQWLYQVGVYLLDRLGGYPLVSLAHLSLILLAFALTAVRISLGGCPRWLQAALVLPAILGMEIRFLERPELFSWVFLVMVLLCLDLHRKGKTGALFFLPVIHLLWANVEGLFPLGWVVIGAYLMTSYFERGRLDPALVKALLASGAATLVNPYGFRALSFPFLLLTRFDPGGFFKKAISEFQSPWTAAASPDSPFFPAFPIDSYRVVSILFLLFILLTIRRRKFHEYGLAFFFFALSALAIRNIPLFFLPVLPTVAKAAADCASFTHEGEGPKERWTPPRGLGQGMAFIVLLICLRVGTGAYYVSERRIIHNGWGMDPEHLPLKVCSFIRQNHLSAPLLNSMGFGGFMEWETQAVPFIDGRLEVMGEPLFRQYELSHAPGGLQTLSLNANFQGIVYDHMMDIPWTKQLLDLEGWRMIYLDDLSALWAAPGYAVNLPTVTPRDLEKDWGVTPLDEGKTIFDIHHGPRSSLGDWLNGFVFPQQYPMPCMRLGSLAYEMGDYESAKDYFLRALVLSGGSYYEVYYNLASAYGKLGQKDMARYCYQCVLDLFPSCPGVTALIAGL